MIPTNAEFQTVTALVVVATAVAYLAREVWKKKTKPGCGGGCGCAGDDGFKKALKRQA